MEEENIVEKLKRLNLDSNLIMSLEDQIKTLEDRIKLLEIENRQLKNESQASDIQTAMFKLQLALKPRFVRLDDLVCNSGLVHVAYKIFGYLDLKSLRNCRLVSKAWKDCVEDDSSYWNRLLDAAKSHPYHQHYHPACCLLDVFPEFVEVFDYLQSKSSIDDIKLFIDFMAEIFDTEGRGFGDVPLHHAIVEKKLDVLKLLMSTPLLFNYAEKVDGQFSSHLSCWFGGPKIVELFCENWSEKDIDFNARDKFDCTHYIMLAHQVTKKQSRFF